MITYKMHFIRTGRTAPAGPEIRYVGQRDLPLCEEGMEELRRLGEEGRYPEVEMVFTSPLRRCVQTAYLLYPNRYTVELPGLMDMNLGRFEGETFETLREDPDFAAWLGNAVENPPPGGEDPLAFLERLVRAVREIFHRMMEEKMSSVAVVTHGGAIMSLLAGIGLPKQPMRQWTVPGGAGYTLLFTPQMWMRDGCAEVFAALPEFPEPDVFGDREQGDNT